MCALLLLLSYSGLLVFVCCFLILLSVRVFVCLDFCGCMIILLLFYVLFNVV